MSGDAVERLRAAADAILAEHEPGERMNEYSDAAWARWEYAPALAAAVLALLAERDSASAEPYGGGFVIYDAPADDALDAAAALLPDDAP